MLKRWCGHRDMFMLYGTEHAMERGHVFDQLRLEASLPAHSRVLLVDDSPFIRELVGEQLRESGWTMALAGSGVEALDIIRTWHPDVVICDMHMPEMAGLEVIGEIRSIDDTLPVVVLSRDDDLHAVLRAVRQGAFDYVIKGGPDIRPLNAALERAVAHGRLARENHRLTRALTDANEALELRLQELDEKHRLLEQAQERSEALLRNILPHAIVERLKEDDGAIAERFSEVTVLFADIVGFTRLAVDRNPIELVGILNEIFSRFDALVERYGLEKIKTIGDAYMAASGLPSPRLDHAEAAADMALDMLRVVDEVRRRDDISVGVRIGMNSGPVVAGVIGTKKFSYDVWGDTVNVASRMEALGIPGQVQITDEVHRRLHGAFILESRGTLDVKGKGKIASWFLKRRK